MSLKPETLDIIVRKVTSKTVFYDLTHSGESKTWEVPANSTFDLKQLRIDVRYKVESNVILTKVKRIKKVGSKHYATGKYQMIERFDWVTAEPLPSYVSAVCMTAKQSRAKHEALRLELADAGDLFNWNPGV